MSPVSVQLQESKREAESLIKENQELEKKLTEVRKDDVKQVKVTLFCFTVSAPWSVKTDRNWTFYCYSAVSVAPAWSWSPAAAEVWTAKERKGWKIPAGAENRAGHQKPKGFYVFTKLKAFLLMF